MGKITQHGDDLCGVQIADHAAALAEKDAEIERMKWEIDKGNLWLAHRQQCLESALGGGMLAVDDLRTKLAAAQQENERLKNSTEFDVLMQDAEFRTAYGKEYAASDKAAAQQEIERLREALGGLERVVTELYPGDVEPDKEHVDEYRAVWSVVMKARAALSGDAAPRQAEGAEG